MKTNLKEKTHATSVRIAKKMNRFFETFSVTQQKIILGFFCALNMLVIVLIFRNAAHPSTGSRTVMMPAKPASTPHIGKNIPAPAAAMISQKQFNRMEHIKNYIDSIARHDTASYQDILRRYPHIRDSIAFFEKLYQSQQKN